MKIATLTARRRRREKKLQLETISLYKKRRVVTTIMHRRQRRPEKGNEKERKLELRQTEPIPTSLATAMLIEKETTADQKLSGGEGAIGGRQQQHQNGLNRKRDMKK